MSPYETQTFKKLQSKWYEKLKKSGFEEIETKNDQLKKWHSHCFLVRSRGRRSARREEYYQLAGVFLNDHEFKTKTEMKLWGLHAQGLSIRTIASILKMQKDKVHKIVVAFRELMLRENY